MCERRVGSMGRARHSASGYMTHGGGYRNSVPPTRIVWPTIGLSIAALVMLRLFVVTILVIEGNAMAPSLRNGDQVILLRGTWGLSAGDVVAFDVTKTRPSQPDSPKPRSLPPPTNDPKTPAPEERPKNGTQNDPSSDVFRQSAESPRRELRDTHLWIDATEVEDRWERLSNQAAQSGVPDSVLGSAATGTGAIGIGRIIALPGQRVTFRDSKCPLGLAGPESHCLIRQHQTKDGRTLEHRGAVQYAVLHSNDSEMDDWAAMTLPDDTLPVEIIAPGYLILSDDRSSHSAFDSRAIGWIDPEHIRGELVFRVNHDPQARGHQRPAGSLIPIP